MIIAQPFDRDGIHDVGACRLFVDADAHWAFATQHADAIDAHWQHAIRTRPNYFNGIVHMTTSLGFDANRHGGLLSITLMRTEFKAYLYWRELGFPPADIVDSFGSALIVGADGGVVLVRQRPGQINSGLTYMPGGFIDDRDVDGAGEVNLFASIDREVLEETGLRAPDVVRTPGIVVARAGPHVSIAVRYRSRLTSDALLGRIDDFIAADPEGELQSAIAVLSVEQLDTLEMPAFARMIAAKALSDDIGAAVDG